MTGSRLLLMRHAKSDWYSGEAQDFLRSLSDRGVRDARRMGGWMAAEGVLPRRILSSPARRTRETLERLGEGAKTDLTDRTEWVDALYHSTLEVLLDVLSTQGEYQELMLLGHNPGLEELLGYLVGTRYATGDFNKQMPTGALYVLETTVPLDRLGRSSAKIVLHQRPKALDA